MALYGAANNHRDMETSGIEICARGTSDDAGYKPSHDGMASVDLNITTSESMHRYCEMLRSYRVHNGLANATGAESVVDCETHSTASLGDHV